MQRPCALILFLLVSLGWHAPVRASGDFECEPSWMLVHRDLTGCDDMAMLSPGNDTRVNLMLLMLDLRAGKGGKPGEPAASQPPPDGLFDWASFGGYFVPPPPDNGDDSGFAAGEGSRCRSNPAGTTAFEAALNSDRGLPDDERALLIQARRSLQPTCAAASGATNGIAHIAQQVKSPSAKNYAAYLQGAEAFYDGDYDAAAAHFAALAAVDQPWLSETARYMLGRVEVNRAQVGVFDEYGDRKQDSTVDPKIIDGAEAALRGYLQVYPQGIYAASAQGLLRRVYWLGGRSDKLAEAYAALLPGDPAARGMTDVDLANEVDSKLLSGPAAVTPSDPILLAVLDLLHMRGPEGENDQDCCGKPIARVALEAQRSSFAADPALFEYLLAAYSFYVERKPAEVAQLIPAAAQGQAFSNLQFSRQMLRGMALEALKDPTARDHWVAILPAGGLPFQRPALELAIALHDERDHGLDRVFAPGSPVQSATLREILLTNVADAALLRRQAKDATVPKHERDVALSTLLYKEVSRGHYADFVKDLGLVPVDAPTQGDDASGSEMVPLGIFTQTTTLGDYGCGPLKETASRLARNPRDIRGQLCLADFLRVNGFDQSYLDTQPDAEELGGTPTLFAGELYARQSVYRTLIASAKTPGADKAYALFRAVNCYAPSGNNSCGGKDVEVNQRKAWFLQLKRDYPKSRWAKALEFYW